MSLTTPTVADINANIIAQLESSLGQTIPVLPKSFLRVLAKVLAAVFVLLYKYVGFVFLQMFVTTASFAETTVNGKTVRPLVEWGRLVGVGDPNEATRAELTILVTVNEQIGSLAAGSILLRETTGVTYSVVSAVALDASTVTATIQASGGGDDGLGGGTIGNLEAADQLTFANPLPYVERAVTVATVENTAADAETESAYRARVLKRFQRKPQGGASADYQAWGEDVEGIAAVYPYASSAPGEINIYVEATVATSDTDGIPSSNQLATVLTALQQEPTTGLDEALWPAIRAPINHGLNVLPITRTQFGVTVASLVVEDAATVQADIDAALDDYMRGLEPYIVGLSTPPRRDRVLLADVSGIVADIVRANSGTFGAITLTLNGGTILAHTLAQGEKARLVDAGTTFT